MRDPVCYECAILHPVPLKGKCHIFALVKLHKIEFTNSPAKISYLFFKNKLESKCSLFFFVVVVVFVCLFFFFFVFFFFCCCCCLFFCFVFNEWFINEVGMSKKINKKTYTKSNDNVKTVPYCHLCEAIKLV